MTTKSILQQEQAAILNVLKGLGAGADLEDIQHALPFPLERRTLQRRLVQLLERGELGIKGKGRATRYFLDASEGGGDDNPIPLSTEARHIRAQVNRPKHQRMPVGYNRDFLEAYHPNETFLGLTHIVIASLRRRRGNPVFPLGTFLDGFLLRSSQSQRFCVSPSDIAALMRVDEKPIIKTSPTLDKYPRTPPKRPE